MADLPATDDDATHCLLCEKLIRPGDLCHFGADSEIACEECAPTWADIREPGFWVDLKTGEPTPPAQIEADIAAHIAAGGELTDKIVTPY